MTEKKTPTAETGQEAKTGDAAEQAKNDPAIQEAAAKKTVAADETEDITGNSRQRFFSQTEVNRIVKREIERALKNTSRPELETAQAKVNELATQLRNKELREQVSEAAARAGAKNATLVFRAIEEKIELDENGKAKNIDDVVKLARRDYPELFRRETNGNSDGGAGQQNHPQLSMNELLRRGRDG